MTRASDDGIASEVFDELLTAARANAPWAFERLYTELAPSVAGYLRLHGAVEPAELTNEVMLGVFRGLGSFEGDAAGFRSWVFTIAHRRLVDERRRNSARPQTTQLSDSHTHALGGDVEQEAFASLADTQVERLLEHLTAEQREVVLLRVVADLSVEQVAHVLGKRVGAVKMLQRRGLSTLRQMLESEGVAP